MSIVYYEALILSVKHKKQSGLHHPRQDTNHSVELLAAGASKQSEECTEPLKQLLLKFEVLVFDVLGGTRFLDPRFDTYKKMHTEVGLPQLVFKKVHSQDEHSLGQSKP